MVRGGEAEWCEGGAVREEVRTQNVPGDAGHLTLTPTLTLTLTPTLTPPAMHLTLTATLTLTLSPTLQSQRARARVRA